ncbi:MAG: 3'-5' exonuclease [Oscillospiraceae bacterium]|nr:3'-5' exonuclease [Oscillospiraceae bacterium]
MTECEVIELKRKALEHYFRNLNLPQCETVFSVKGPVLVLAGAGSGKTTAIINRIAGMVYFGDAWNQSNSNIFPDDAEYLQSYINDESEEDICRLREILAVYPIRPWNILAITFTNKAAGEMKARLANILGEEEASEINASTFHSACVRILRRSINLLGYSKDFTIYDSDDSKRLMKNCIVDMDVSEKMFSPKSVLNEISRAKDRMISPDELLNDSGSDYRKSVIAKLYGEYQRRLKASNALDFDDLIYLTVCLFEQYPDELEYYQNRYRYILVDEYQDTNHAQFRLIELLAGKNLNLCVVGDDDQSIYRFRGATIENILSFEQTFAGSKVIRLEQNYRSTQTILNAANSVIANNMGRKEKRLWTEAGEGNKIIWYKASDESDESAFVAKSIVSQVSDGANYRDFAILYRMNAQSNALERMFIRNGIPYRIYGGTRFYDRKEVKDIMAYLSLINNENDSLRFHRIVNEPKRGIGDATIALIDDISRDLHISPIEVMRNADSYPVLKKRSGTLKGFAEMIDMLSKKSDEIPFDELLDLLLDKSGYSEYLRSLGEEGETRLENIEELKSSMIAYAEEAEEPSLSGFLEEIALFTDVDKYEPEQDVVLMMTMHSAKGLEFNNVYIVGFEEGVFPGVRTINSIDTSDMEEERRLAYVAITRAKKQLYITSAERRMLFGSTMHNSRSRFLGEIDFSLIDKQVSSNLKNYTEEKKVGTLRSITLQEQLAKNTKEKQTPTEKNLTVGERVSHNIFGDGTVLNVTKIANDSLVEIAFDRVGTKKLMANFAKIKKITE